MQPLSQILARLSRGRRPSPERAPYAAPDLVRRVVRAGAVELPILNLAGLWALRALVAEDGNDADGLIKLLWILRHQQTDRMLDIAAHPPSPEELAAVARAVDLVSLPDYVAALDAMLELVSKKKNPPDVTPPAMKPSA